MIIKFMSELKKKVGESVFKEIIKMAEEDIKFNRVGFGRTTSQEQFVIICKKCHAVLLKC